MDYGIGRHETMDQGRVIRSAQKGDMAALSELAIKTYSDAFGHTMSDADLSAHVQMHLAPSQFARIIDEDVVLLAEMGGRLIGFVQFGAADLISAQNEEQELRRLYVHRDFQNAGLGTMLMDAALDHSQLRDAKCILLDVWEHNQGAQRFYRRYGFEVIGTRPFVVESGAATSQDFVMVRHAAGSVRPLIGEETADVLHLT